ncbi:vomeronasal type-2 receptor 1-like [Dasypus novemcinctus]|uniref:vomeronasal type-2 receptor 1-like n=1 Tax=Dasypus novemcinctus TaxID=9361 RepID=UPI00265EBC1A|nr:vomeronasal type-2 receptor 1-like [Dasypus novemcinctus]
MVPGRSPRVHPPCTRRAPRSSIVMVAVPCFLGVTYFLFFRPSPKRGQSRGVPASGAALRGGRRASPRRAALEPGSREVARGSLQRDDSRVFSGDSELSGVLLTSRTGLEKPQPQRGLGKNIYFYLLYMFDTKLKDIYLCPFLEVIFQKSTTAGRQDGAALQSFGDGRKNKKLSYTKKAGNSNHDGGRSRSAESTRFNFRGFRWLKTMIHTIKEINERKDILPNITLGYQIFDNCYTISKAMEASLVFLTGQEENKPNFRNSTGAYLAGIIGSGGSSLSVAASRLLGLYYLPQVGYASTCSALSDKYQFPSYLRTIINDKAQSAAMVNLIQHFGWVWIGTIAADDDYGKYGVKVFKEIMEGAKLCIAFSEIIPKIYSYEKMQKAVNAVKHSTARVIVLYASDIDLSPFVLEMVYHNITDRTWIASEAWITSALIAKPEYFPYFGGSLGFAISRADIPGLKEFLYDIHPSKDPNDVLTIEFWQTAFNCTWPNSSVPYNTDHRKNMTGKEDRLYAMSDTFCTGEEKLEDLKNTYLDVSQLRITNNVKQAVYAMAYALDHLSRCEEGQGPFVPGNTCAYIPDFEPWQLMFYLKSLRFTTHNGIRMKIDDNGDVTGYYDLLNWQLNDNGEIDFVKVGEYIFTDTKFELAMDESAAIFWNTESSKLPYSVCTDECTPGTRKGIRQGEPICCFDCIPCADGHVSREAGQRECDKCDEDYWSNAQKSECVLKEVEFLAYDEALGFTLVILSIFGALAVLAVTTIYIIYRKTPLVNANYRELSFLIQVSLIITLLSSMLFIGKPYNWSCMARQVTLAFGFSLCLSCILGKTISLFLAYRISKSKTRLISIHPLYWKIIVLVSVLVEIGICTAYLVSEPPRVYKNMESQSIKIILECNEGSIEFLCSIFGVDVFLALLCFLTTVVARQLPDNYYEGKCITFGMLAFFIVWISFVPAYLSTKGKFKVAVEIFAILASSYGLLGCIFAPKCFIILLRPKRNTDELVGGRVPTTDKSIQLTSASVSSELNNTTASSIVPDD